MAKSRSHRAESRRATAGPINGAANDAVYVLTRRAVRCVDRDAVEVYGLPSIVLMENAARGLAHEACRMLAARGCASGKIVIICGNGNNGGDGYALARHLHNAGHQVALAPLGEPTSGGDAAGNRDVCIKMMIRQIDITDELPAVLVHADLIVDAIFGTGLDRPVTGTAAQVIGWINAAERPVLAADIPSGLDCDTGKPLGIAVRATRTVTFVGYKPGSLALEAQPYVGEVVVADIGAPVELTRKYGTPLARSTPDDTAPVVKNKRKRRK